MADWPKTLKESFCEAFGCPSERFVPVAFKKCLHRRVRLFRPFIVIFQPDYFHPDYEMIECLGNARSWADVDGALGAFASNNRLRGGFARKVLKFRASGHRVTRLVERVIGRGG
jgi:hypothetical protein